MRYLKPSVLLAAACLFVQAHLYGQDLASTAQTYRPRLETNLTNNIAAFWFAKTIDRTNGGYLMNHDIEGRLKGPGSKMIVTQARNVWLFSRLARAGYGGREYLLSE